MRILMLGNSFTSANNLPQLIAKRTGAEVVAHTRGGARLKEHLNPNTKMGAKTLAALKEEPWDFVILQEMSNGPITSKESFRDSAGDLCDLIWSIGAKPVLFAINWGRLLAEVKLFPNISILMIITVLLLINLSYQFRGQITTHINQHAFLALVKIIVIRI